MGEVFTNVGCIELFYTEVGLEQDFCMLAFLVQVEHLVHLGLGSKGR